MKPFSALLDINRIDEQPVYIQISNQLVTLIRNGTLVAYDRLPSTRVLAAMLGVHRKTVIQAYDELLAQGWLESRVGNGTFVASTMPVPRLQKHLDFEPSQNGAITAGFALPNLGFEQRPIITYNQGYHLDDGFPDTRLAPLNDLARAYRSQLITGNSYTKLGYNDPRGSSWLREQLSVYLNDTRGLHTSPENIMIVRGTTMGLHLTATGLISDGDYVVTGDTSWAGATTNFVHGGAKIITVPVDEYGIDTMALARICQKTKIRLLYTTSHHHYPTTVALRADRRLELIRLAEQYGFIIFEDDYDYDFHYLSKPLPPLAATDPHGMVLYCGSFTKCIAPAFRVGYLVGAENVIKHLSAIRRISDRQGDIVLENALAELLQTGVIQRHLRKSLREYRIRRDFFCETLRSELSERLNFRTPDGGLAVWTQFDQSIDMQSFSEKAEKEGLSFANGYAHGLPAGSNFTRLGFASSNCQELEICIQLLKKLLK